jgi:hypothetical protein
MKRLLLAPLCLAALGALSAQARPASAWSLAVTPSVSIPLVAGDFSANTLFSPAWGGTLGAEYRLRTAFPLALRLGAGYSLAGLKPAEGIAVSGTLNEVEFIAGMSSAKALSPALSLRGFLDGSLVLGSLPSGFAPPYGGFRAGLGLDLKLTPSLSARLDAAAVYKGGLYGGIGAGLGLAYALPERAQASAPARLRLLDLVSIDIKNVFPIFRSYYDQNPVGTAKIANTGKETATDVKVSFIIKQYMDAPKECATIQKLEPGNSIEVPLYGLFNDRILDVTEATKVSAEVFVTYGVDGEQSRAATVLVYDRNALTWSDDRKAAAFVSSKDPWVLDLTGNILAAVKGERNPELAKNLQTAVAFHEGLRAYGISYVLSPNRPFAKEVVDPEVVDTLKFPRQTLTFRAGDCADLSVLYASCFEAAGIETAFVTIPGHIFMAIDLGMSLEEAKARAIDEKQLIVQGDRVWLPIETTMRDAGFLEVWNKAATEWREASARDLAAIYPLHEAWKTYAPVGLPADGTSVSAPAPDKVIKAFDAELAKAIDAELGGRLALLGPAPKAGESGVPVAKVLNDRGVLFGKFARYAEAEKSFQAAVKAGSISGLVNLGNIAMLKSDATGAYTYYQMAAKQITGSAGLYVNMAKAAAALGKNADAAAALEIVKRLDPAAAEKYSSLAQVGSAGTRAAEIDDSKPIWF